MRNNSLFEQAALCVNNSIESFVISVLPNGIKRGHEYIALNPTRSDSSLGSFGINLINGKWADFATGDKGGDIISLYAYLCGLSQYEAAKAIVGGDIITSYVLQPLKSTATAQVSNSKYYKKIWQESHCAENSLVTEYFKSRCIAGAIPPTIRYHHKLYHKPTGFHFPAMVAAVTVWPHIEVSAIHRTYLKPDGTGKANVAPNKMMLGSVKSGAVRLSNPSSKLILTEGIETALSVAMSTGLPTWATLSTSGMLNVEVPPLEITQKIIIAADNDNAGIGAANKLADRLLSAGYGVQIAMPPEGMDFNDLLQGQNNE